MVSIIVCERNESENVDGDLIEEPFVPIDNFFLFLM